MPKVREEGALGRRTIEGLDAELIEEAREALAEVEEFAAEGVPILVEGKKDRETLERLGIRGTILELSTGDRTLNFLEGLECERVLILTDFDTRGRELASFCYEHLIKLGVEPILEPYQKLSKLGKKFKEVESLVKLRTLLERIEWRDQKTTSWRGVR
jgi:5S rRNA maturation endonuclease (ribonuclease M5)